MAAQHTLLDYYRAIENASVKMLEAAQAEDWDQVVKLEGACAVLIAQLRHRSRTDDLGPEERKEKTRIMQRILKADAEIRCLAEPWLNDLEQLLDRQGQSMH
jgi:flagellar protein FliT